MENSVVAAIKSGHADQVVDVVETWIHTPDPKLSAMWDVRIGNMMWTRCISGDVIDHVELEALLKLFRFMLTKYFAAKNEFVMRLKAISVLLKFFIAKNKMVITDLGEKILNYILRNYEHIEEKDKEEFYNTTSTFYGVTWNMMRENVSKLEESVSLQLVSQSIQFLMYNLPEKLETVAAKLYQCNSIVLGCNKVEIVNSFLENLVLNSEKILKKVVKKEKPTKKRLNIVHFEAFCQIVFIVSRYLIANLEFDKARKLYRILITSWRSCCPTDVLESLSEILEFYLKINEFIIRPNDILTNLGSELTDFLALKLSKSFETKNGGFRLILLYTFAESIWHCMLHAFKKSELVTCDETESNTFEDFIEGFKDFAVSLESLPTSTYNGSLIGKRQEIEVNLLMLPMRFFSDRVNKKDAEVTSNMCTTVEACYSKVMSVCLNIPKSSIKMITENYNRMCHCSSQIAFGYQKRKMYSMSLSWCLKGESSLQSLTEADSSFESAINPCTLSVLIADCNRHLEQPEEGLRNMALMLWKNKSLLESFSPVYDLYESPAWNDWNNHWNQLKRDLYHQDRSKVSKTVIDYIVEEGTNNIDQKFRRDALRHEINSYFTNRQVIPEAMLSVGGQLEDLSENYEDRVLGLLSQIVAIWWSDETQIDSAILLCKEALDTVYKSSKTESKSRGSTDVFQGFDDEYYDKQCYDSKQDKKTQDDTNKNSDHSVFENDIKGSCGYEGSKQAKCSSVLLLSSLVRAWSGLCVWRKNTGIAERDVTEYYDICEQRREKIRLEGLDEEEACAESDHAYVGNTKLTFEDEMTVVDHFLKAIDGLYLLIQFGDTVKQLFDATCPALIMCTSRLVSHLMLTFGHTMYAIKSWQVTYFLAKIYNRKGLTVLCASELLKLVCNPNADYVLEATEINENAQSSNLIKNYKGLYYRLHLAHAVACYHNKLYEEGAVHLSKVLQETEKLENEQFTSFIRGEALLVFALYKRSAATNGFKLSKVYDIHIMSPCDMFEDGYRTLTELNREVDIINSGWTDTYHNYLLFSTLLHNADTIIGYFQEAGLQFEVRSAATEIVNQALSFGCVSRAVQMLTYLATEDLVGKNFNHCITKFDIINKSMQKLFPHHRAHSSERIKEFVKEKLSMPNLKINLKRLEDQKEVRWNLKLIVNPEETTDDELSSSDIQEEISSQPFTAQPFTPYSFFLHPFNCYCYICTHPYIIPDALKFLHLQAKYSIGTNNPKKCLVLFEVAKRYHLRAMFRLMYNGDRIREKMFLNKKDAQVAYTVIYTPFFTEPAIHRLGLQMEATPSENLENMIVTMNEYVDLLKLKDSNDMVAMSIPYEILCSAVMDLDEMKLLKTNSMCRCTPLETTEMLDLKHKDSKLERNKKIEVVDLSEDEEEEGDNFKYLDKYNELDEKDEKFLLKITEKLASLKIVSNGDKGHGKNGDSDSTPPNKMEVVPTSPEVKEIVPLPGKLEIPKIPKKGLKKYAVQSQDSHNPFAKSKPFTVYEDFDTPPHPKPIPFSVPLVDLEASDHEKENDEELDNKKVTIRRPRRVARPEKTRGKDSDPSNK